MPTSGGSSCVQFILKDLCEDCQKVEMTLTDKDRIRNLELRLFLAEKRLAEAEALLKIQEEK